MSRFNSFSFLLLLISTLSFACKRDGPVPVVSIIDPVSNTIVSPGLSVSVKVLVESQLGVLQMELEVLDDKLVPISPKVTWDAAGSETTNTIIIPDKEYTNSELFLRVKAIDLNGEATDFLRLNLRASNSTTSGYVSLEKLNERNVRVIISNDDNEELERFEFNELPLVSEVVDDKLVLIGAQNEGVLVYDLVQKEILWEKPGGGGFGNDFFTAAYVNETSVFVVENGVGLKEYFLQNGNAGLAITSNTTQFHKSIAIGAQSLFILEDNNPSSDRVAAYFKATGSFNFDAVLNDDYLRVHQAEPNSTNDAFYLFKENASSSYEMYLYKFGALSSVDSFGNMGEQWFYSEKNNRLYFLSQSSLYQQQVGQTANLLSSDVQSFYIGPAQNELTVTYTDGSFQKGNISTTNLDFDPVLNSSLLVLKRMSF